MRRCYYLCSEECVGDDLSQMLTQLRKMQANTPKTFLSRFEIFSNVKRHYMLGVAHSLDIVNSIHKRFITGSGHPDTIFIKSILGGNR